MAGDDNVVPLFEPGWAATVRLMERLKIPVTRQSDLELAYAGELPEWHPEPEEQLPPFLRDDSRTFKPRKEPDRAVFDNYFTAGGLCAPLSFGVRTARL